MVLNIRQNIFKDTQYMKIKTNIKSKSAKDEVLVFQDYKEEEQEENDGYQEVESDQDMNEYGEEEFDELVNVKEHKVDPNEDYYDEDLNDMQDDDEDHQKRLGQDSDEDQMVVDEDEEDISDI